MIKILLSGCSGHMGKVITQCSENFEDCQIVVGTDLVTEKYSDFPIYDSPEKVTEDVDVIIDFSHPSALSNILNYAVSNKTPIVVATTGLDAEQVETIKKASEIIPVFYTANMSLGVNLIAELAKKATAVLGNSFDIEVVEMHHNQKIDAPSGTAIMLADEIAETMNTNPKYEFDRHSKRQKRTKNEIGIHSLRGGTVVGEHEIVFAGDDEVIKISHSAASKKLFANGSLNAARYISKCTPGMYSMKDLLNM